MQEELVRSSQASLIADLLLQRFSNSQVAQMAMIGNIAVRANGYMQCGQASVVR